MKALVGAKARDRSWFVCSSNSLCVVCYKLDWTWDPAPVREVIRRSPGVAPLDVAVAELHNHPEACLLLPGFHNFDIDTYFTHYLEKVHFDGLLRIFADKNYW